MVKLLIDLLDFLRSCAPLFTSVTILTLLCILAAKSIKKYSTVYYIVLGMPFVLVACPFIARLLGFQMSGFTSVPFLGAIIRDYIHMGTFGHPLLIIIMYMGALDPKIPAVRKLMSIRKELSIISGFPVFTHSLIRVTNNFPNSLKFFTNNADYLANANVTSELGAGISNFSFVLGIVMLVIFIPLWVTSFDAVRKRMGGKKWKKLQKWSYVLYATLFIHAMGIQIGGMMNPRGGHGSSRPTVEAIASVEQNEQSEIAGRQREQGEVDSAERGSNAERGDRGERGNRAERGDHAESVEHDGRGDRDRTDKIGRDNNAEDGDYSGRGREDRNGRRGRNETAGPGRGEQDARSEGAVSDKDDQSGRSEVAERGQQGQQTARSGGGGRTPSKGFGDIEVSAQAKRNIHIISLLLIFGSYLFLRLRKAKKDAKKKSATA